MRVMKTENKEDGKDIKEKQLVKGKEKQKRESDGGVPHYGHEDRMV